MKRFRFLYSPTDGGGTGAEVEGVADPTASTEVVEPTTTTEVTSETTTEPVKEKDPEKAFAARLGHERKKLESEYGQYKGVIEKQAKAAGVTPEQFLSQLQAEQEKAELEAEADKTGKTPNEVRLEREKAEIDARLKEVERKDKLTAEEKTLVADPKIGKFVSENLTEIREIAESMGVDLQTGLALVTTKMLPTLLENANPEKHVQAYLESVKKGAKPVEIGGGATTPSAAPAPKTFEEARKAAMELLRSEK